ncbi:phosphonate ABC transporter ATP-binding protein [Mucilaginibacter sp. cycad4]|uniref:phosphonate ABC transporter ATP-binding protein n=1 Tax=Mucilaginibacter sp. cycad4 TaxID=3342096 RepID=UPI002AABF006|nr:phosphonate ABC transporter ATP-binding protein [Mucilaginibacter gossypii]WPV00772.1 phosphonate ABC transporter ATP-binding protein [Mucilaginibacter gossypii]
MIEVKGLTKTLPNGRKLLNGIDFTVKKGEFVGILGPSGAGKTLTLRCLNGLLKPDEGSVLVEDEHGKKNDICRINKKQLRHVRERIGVIFQGYHLVKRLTVLENVMIGRLGQISTFRSLVYGFTDKEAEEALLALEKVKMAHLAQNRTGSLSGGEMQRVAIARAIFQSPMLLLADEPISNLDPSNAKVIMKLIRPLSENIPVVGVFHQPEMTAKYCTRVIAIKDGQVIYDGDPKLSNQTLEDIYGEELAQMEQHEHSVPTPEIVKI